MAVVACDLILTTVCESETRAQCAVLRQDEGQALFSIAPPPPAASASAGFSQQGSGDVTNGKSAAELGFDDGEYGEFQ